MRGVFRILILGGIIVAVSLIIAAIPGRVTAEAGQYSIELSTSFAILLLLILVVLISLLVGLLRLPGHIAGGYSRRSRRRGDIATTRALVALAAADGPVARREAGRARLLLGDTPQTLLLTAEAARLDGRDHEAGVAFNTLAEHPDASFLGLRGQLRQAMTKGDWAAAETIAARAEHAYPGAAWLREERTRLAIRTDNWPSAMRLAVDGSAKAALATAAAERETDATVALDLARQAWEADATLAPAAVAYARRLRAAKQERRAERVLTESWVLRPSPAIADAVLEIPAPDALARKLVASNPDHAESHLLLARAALATGTIDTARREAEAARAAGLHERRLFLLVAEIEKRAGKSGEEALQQASGAEPDTVWRCTNCHSAAAQWQPACPVCLTPGGLTWGVTGSAIPGREPGVIRRLLRFG